MDFRVRENAGLRRFSYPVRARFAGRGPAATLRLLEDGKPVPSQFTQVTPSQIEVNFNASTMPWEVRRYRVEEGAGPAAADTMRVDETATAFLVRHPSGLEFEVPKNLLGLLNVARTRDVTYTRPGSLGLGLILGESVYRAGGVSVSGPVKGTVVKQGPLACALRFESREERDVASVVELEFPRSKSWMEVSWNIEDPLNHVAGLYADVNLQLEGPRKLVDFGAGSYVYAALREGQGARMSGVFRRADWGYDWNVEVGGEAYASGHSHSVEGWAHVMDDRRATAVAVADFARYRVTNDRMEWTPDGRFILRRLTGGTNKDLRFWLHFVGMPVQVGAATSPQSMQNPLVVEWS